MAAQERNIEAVANNIANVNTTGFKKSRANFQDLLYQTLRMPGAETAEGVLLPEGIQIGHGVKTSSISRSFIRETSLLMTPKSKRLFIGISKASP